MMKKRVVLLALLAAVLTSSVLTGCGKQSNAVPGRSSAVALEPEKKVESSKEVTSSKTTTSSKTPSTTETKALTKKEYKAQCEAYDYEKMARRPDDYQGKYAKFYGQVIQVMEEGDGTLMRVATKVDDYGNYYKDVIFVIYYRESGEDRILEDDMVTFYGEFDGLFPYNTVMGNALSIPILLAEYVEFDDKKEPDDCQVLSFLKCYEIFVQRHLYHHRSSAGT